MMRLGVDPQWGGPSQPVCAIYARAAVSQLDFDSCAMQRATCIDYIRGRPNWVLATRQYEDRDCSGLVTSRPALEHLLADARAGKFDIVVVSRIDRLTRSLHDFAVLMQKLEATGVNVVSVAENFATTDVAGRAMLRELRELFPGFFNPPAYAENGA